LITTEACNTRHRLRNTQYVRRVNYAKQTQFSKYPKEYKPCYDKVLLQFTSPRTLQKQTQFKPNHTQFMKGQDEPKFC